MGYVSCYLPIDLQGVFWFVGMNGFVLMLNIIGFGRRFPKRFFELYYYYL
jgi:hypothetical protein